MTCRHCGGRLAKGVGRARPPMLKSSCSLGNARSQGSELSNNADDC